MHVYESLDDVPASLGTMEDHLYLNRSVPDGARPDAMVRIPGSGLRPLYRAQATRPLPEAIRGRTERIRAKRTCTRCGRAVVNRLGKTVEAGPGGLCRSCENANTRKEA